jgi:hypothetical protein
MYRTSCIWLLFASPCQTLLAWSPLYLRVQLSTVNLDLLLTTIVGRVLVAFTNIAFRRLRI